MIYILTLVLAFCSIVYELILSQALSAFLGNTVLRYSVTIGLYMFSMGMGALAIRERLTKYPVVVLQIIELILALLGGYSLCLLFLVDWLNVPVIIFSIFAHSLIIVIGVLSGAEIPLLIAIRAKQKENCEGKILGFDYIGAFVGTLIFAFYFYPKLGLTATAISVAILNSVVGVLLLTQINFSDQKELKFRNYVSTVTVVLLIILSFSLYRVQDMQQFLLGLYLGGS